MSTQATVLHVDDDPALLRLVQEVFADVGDELAYASAASGEDALDELDGIAGPVLLLVDRRLPGTDLWTFVDEAADELGVAGVPTFVLSGSEDPAAVAEAYANGAAAYIEKPIDAEGFFEVARLIGRYVELATFPTARP